jgi:hypothetical protein
MSYRNSFIVSPLVDLFGRSGWMDYRRTVLSFPAPPKNYKGEVPGDWPASEKRELLSRYKVSVCLENVNEPYYFTEKFVEAVCAGCIPVYRPDTYTASGALKGAFWVDPRDYGNDPQATLTAALELNLHDIQEQNRAWLMENLELKRSNQFEVFSRIGQILSDAGSQQNIE